VQTCRVFVSQSLYRIETPLLTKATPEGSRDFVVPSRLQPGMFFALPQSPQQYKQLLMTAGFERYFQTARALRDEDLRADRGFEHTQIDIEMSFVQRDDVMNMVEGMVIHAAESLGYTIKEKPFPRISYKESMEKYGADKFDMRTEEEKAAGILAYAWVIDFPFFEKDEKSGKWTFTHNPFSAPLPEFLEDHLAGRNIENILTSQYDLVCNGYESGGGSIRAHDPEVLTATYRNMGYTEEETEQSVGHMIEAFDSALLHTVVLPSVLNVT
jgi:aspartyl-tRNA synthetase